MQEDARGVGANVAPPYAVVQAWVDQCKKAHTAGQSHAGDGLVQGADMEGGGAACVG